MKKLRRLLTMLLLALTMTTTLFPAPALAESRTYKGTRSYTYTIQTKKKDAKLKISPKKGKAKVTVWKNPLKGTTKDTSKSLYGDFKVTVSGGGTTQTVSVSMFSKSITLKKNTTYSVTVTYTGYPIGGYWNVRWTKDPSVKINVNNWADIR